MRVPRFLTAAKGSEACAENHCAQTLDSIVVGLFGVSAFGLVGLTGLSWAGRSRSC